MLFVYDFPCKRHSPSLLVFLRTSQFNYPLRFKYPLKYSTVNVVNGVLTGP